MPDVPLAPLALLALVALAPLASVELAKAARWRALFGPHRPTYAVALRALIAGQLTNSLSPLRAGEAVRLGVLKAQGGALVPGAAAVAGAKAIDTVCLAAIAFAVAGASAFSHRNVGLAAGLLVIAGGVALAFGGGKLRSWLESNRLTRRLRLAALVDVARAARDPRVLLTVTLATGVVWVAGLAANVAVLAAVGVGIGGVSGHSVLDLAARVIVAGYLVNLVPSPPVQLGTFEAAVAAALASAGMPLDQALLAAVTLHVCQLVKLGILLLASLALTRDGGIRRLWPPEWTRAGRVSTPPAAGRGSAR